MITPVDAPTQMPEQGKEFQQKNIWCLLRVQQNKSTQRHTLQKSPPPRTVLGKISRPSRQRLLNFFPKRNFPLENFSILVVA